MIFKRKLHREVEKSIKLKKNDLKQPFEDLKLRHKYTDVQIIDVVKGAIEYCKVNKMDDTKTFLAAVNLYVSCLNNPKKVEAGPK